MAEMQRQQLLKQLNSLQQEKHKQECLLTETAESNRKLQADLVAAQAVIGSLERTLRGLMPAHLSTNAKG